MKGKKRGLKVLAALLATAALAFGLEALQIATQPPEYEAEPRIIQAAGEADLEKAELENAEYKSGAVNVSAGGSVTIDLGKEEDVSVFELWAKKHIRQDVNLKVYYAAAGEDFSEDRSVSLLADKSLMAWEPAVPAGKYQRLRIEADGKINFNRLVYSPEILEMVPIPESMRLWRVGLIFPFLFALILFLMYKHAGRRLLDVLRRAGKGLTESGKRTAGLTLLFLAAGTAGYFLARVHWMGSLQPEMNLPRQLFCGAVGLALASLVTFTRTLGKKPENLFLILCLCTGLLMVYLYPPMPYISWDDDYHFDQALTWSYLGEERITSREDINLLFDADFSEWFNGEEAQREILRRGQEQYDGGVDAVESKPLEHKNVYEFFGGLGMYAGRVLRLPYYWIFCMGRLFNLLTYAIVGWFAIHRLKSGRMMLAGALMIPTAMFLATQYAYDPGVTAFTALGLAYAYAEWQEPDRQITWETALIIFISMTFGCLTKAIYFPMLLLPLLMPKKKFRQAGRPAASGAISRGAYWMLGIAGILILLGTFMLPILTGGTTSDTRGGEDVDAYGQIAFILGNPLGYAKILLTFLGALLNPVYNSPALLTAFGYMGYPSLSMVYMILLAVLAFTDKTKADRPLAKSVWTRLFTLLVLAGTAALVATSMYILFTNVASESISGEQHRYLIPLIFPLMMILGSELVSRPLKLEIPWRRRLYNGLAFAVIAFVLFTAVWETCISRFVL